MYLLENKKYKDKIIVKSYEISSNNDILVKDTVKTFNIKKPELRELYLTSSKKIYFGTKHDIKITELTSKLWEILYD